KPCVIELQGPRAPSASPGCMAEPWRSFLRFTMPGGCAEANRDGWWESVVAISLDPATNCGCAHLRVVYGRNPAGFSLNVGDSPTNDGFGGDQGPPRARR